MTVPTASIPGNVDNGIFVMDAKFVNRVRT